MAKSITDKKIIYEVTVLANISFLKELGIMHHCRPKDCCCKGKKTIQQISKIKPMCHKLFKAQASWILTCLALREFADVQRYAV